MKFLLSAKFFFIILIILIIITLAFNYINRNKQINSEIKNIDPSKDGKTVGVNIEQNHSNGDKIKIVADLMEENKEKKIITLINPITKIINNKNNITKITSNYGYIINNYSKFKLDKNVTISNDKKRFALKTDELTGTFDTGDMHTYSPVKIQIRNSKIQGSSLNLKNYGEYIKVFGKAKLTIN